jgi:hypothetical protein
MVGQLGADWAEAFVVATALASVSAVNAAHAFNIGHPPFGLIIGN